MAIIKLAKAPTHAFNKHRVASDLLKMQVKHLRAIGEKVSGEDLAAAAKRVKTEGQAAVFIARVTRMLHPEGAGVGAPPGAVPQIQPVPPTPPVEAAATRPTTLPRAARKTTRRNPRTRKAASSKTKAKKTGRPARPRRASRRKPR